MTQEIITYTIVICAIAFAFVKIVSTLYKKFKKKKTSSTSNKMEPKNCASCAEDCGIRNLVQQKETGKAPCSE